MADWVGVDVGQDSRGVFALRLCTWCTALYVPKRYDQRTCGAECRRKLNNAENNKIIVHEPRPCGVCGTVWTPKRSDNLYCSTHCYSRATYKYAKVGAHANVCIRCGTEFESVRSNARYCSMACSHADRYAANPGPAKARAAAWNRSDPRRQNVSRRAAAKRRARIDGSRDSVGVSQRDWLRQIRRQSYRCAYCGSEGKLHLEHVIPISRGGRDAIGNVVAACESCNTSKGAKSLMEWRIWRQKAANAA